MMPRLKLFLYFCAQIFVGVKSQNPCGQFVYSLRDDTCDKIRVAFQLTSATFNALNGNLDCTRLRARESKICVASREEIARWKADENRRCSGPRIKIMEGDDCSKIEARLEVDRNHLISNNPEMDCDSLSPGDIICAATRENGGDFGTTLAPTMDLFCENGQSIEIGDQDSCQSISRRYDISERQLQAENPDLDCNSLSVGSRLCIQGRGSSTSPSITTDQPLITRCPGKFVTANGNETCSYFRNQFNIDSNDFKILNPNLDCVNGPIKRGRLICIRKPRISYVPLPYQKRRGVENLQLLAIRCTKWHSVSNDDTCWTIRSLAQLDEKSFFSLNPGLDCSSLKLGQQICLKNKTTSGKPCRLTFITQTGQTCDNVITMAKITLDQLKSLNPSIDCDRLEPNKQLCLSLDDPFENQEAGGAEDFLSTASTQLSQRSLIDSETAAKISRLIESGGTGADSNELIDVLANEKSIELIKAVTQNNPNFRRLSSEFDRRRSIICVQLTEGQPAYKRCVCDAHKPFIHCQALLLKDLKSNAQSAPPRHKRRHSRKRRNRFRNQQPSTPTFGSTAQPRGASNVLSTVGGALADFWRFFQKLCPNCIEEGCLAAGACFIIPEAPIFQICLSGGVCVPNPAMLITSDKRITVNQFFASQMDFGVGVCITGVSAVFKLVGLAACVASVDLRYYYLRQQLELHPQIALVAVRAYLDALVQVADSVTSGLYDSDNNVPLSDLCMEEAYQCNDFCQLDRGGVVVRYNVEVWFFGWRSVQQGDIKGLPDCKTQTLPPPDTLKRLVAVITDKVTDNGERPDYCKLHDYTFQNIPLDVGITHILYSSIIIDSRSFKIIDPDHDIDQLRRLKDSGVKIIVSVGGKSFCENEQTQSVFPNMAKSKNSRRAFIDSSIKYLKKYSFHGVDVAWINPRSEDKISFSSLISEFRLALDQSKSDFLLTVTLSNSINISKEIDIGNNHQYLDFINVMTLDYHVPKNPYQTDAINVQSPIIDCSCAQEGDVEMTIEGYLIEGVPPEKLNLGLSTFGRVFKLDENGRQAPNQFVSGECTTTAGLLAWYEIKTRVEEIKIDNKTLSAYSLYGEMEWVSFDNQITHSLKLCFARYKFLGGVAVWSANLDDNFELIESIGRFISDPSLHACADFETSKCEEKIQTRSGAIAPTSGAIQSQRSKSPTCSSSSPPNSKRCSPASCTTPPNVVNANKEKLTGCANQKAGSSCSIECLQGYVPNIFMANTICVRLFGSFAMWLPPIKCQPSKEVNRLCGGDSRTPIVPIFDDPLSATASTTPHYVVKFNRGTKIPIWTVYASRNLSTSDRQYRFSAYQCHKDDQLRLADYKNSTYVPSRLVPQVAFGDAGGRRATNFMVNVAAQSKRAKFGPWTILENRLASFSNLFPSIIATGLCPIQIDQPQSIPVSSCFWKIVCTKFPDSSRVTVAAFYHENIEALSTDQVKVIRNQGFISEKVGDGASISDIWLTTKQWLPNTNGAYPSMEACANQLTLDDNDKQFWQGLIDDQRHGSTDWTRYDEEAASASENDFDEEKFDETLAYRVRMTPYERCGRIINGHRKNNRF